MFKDRVIVKIQVLATIHLLSLTQTKQILVSFHYVITLCSDLKPNQTNEEPCFLALTDVSPLPAQFCRLILGYNLTQKNRGM